MAPQFTTQVKGLKEVMNALKRLRPEAFKQLRADMRVEIKPVVNKIQESIPQVAPLSGFNHSNRRPLFPGYNSSNPRAIGISTPTSVGGRNAAIVLELRESSAAVAVIDAAGQRTDNPLARALQRKGVGRNRERGRAQRFAWPTTQQNKDLVVKAVDKIMDKVTSQTSLKIKAGI